MININNKYNHRIRLLYGIYIGYIKHVIGIGVVMVQYQYRFYLCAFQSFFLNTKNEPDMSPSVA